MCYTWRTELPELIRTQRLVAVKKSKKRTPHQNLYLLSSLFISKHHYTSLRIALAHGGKRETNGQQMDSRCHWENTCRLEQGQIKKLETFLVGAESVDIEPTKDRNVTLTGLVNNLAWKDFQSSKFKAHFLRSMGREMLLQALLKQRRARMLPTSKQFAEEERRVDEGITSESSRLRKENIPNRATIFSTVCKLAIIVMEMVWTLVRIQNYGM